MVGSILLLYLFTMVFSNTSITPVFQIGVNVCVSYLCPCSSMAVPLRPPMSHIMMEWSELPENSTLWTGSQHSAVTLPGATHTHTHKCRKLGLCCTASQKPKCHEHVLKPLNSTSLFKTLVNLLQVSYEPRCFTNPISQVGKMFLSWGGNNMDATKKLCYCSDHVDIYFFNLSGRSSELSSRELSSRELIFKIVSTPHECSSHSPSRRVN